MTLAWFLMTAACILLASSRPYDPDDTQISSLLPNGTFEAFYPAKAFGQENGASRAAHGHGSFYSARHPALVDVKNAAAYGFRFDGYRRFNFD